MAQPVRPTSVGKSYPISAACARILPRLAQTPRCVRAWEYREGTQNTAYRHRHRASGWLTLLVTKQMTRPDAPNRQCNYRQLSPDHRLPFVNFAEVAALLWCKHETIVGMSTLVPLARHRYQNLVLYLVLCHHCIHSRGQLGPIYLRDRVRGQIVSFEPRRALSGSTLPRSNTTLAGQLRDKTAVLFPRHATTSNTQHTVRVSL